LSQKRDERTTKEVKNERIRLKFCRSDDSCAGASSLCNYGGCVDQRDMRTGEAPPTLCNEVRREAKLF